MSDAVLATDPRLRQLQQLFQNDFRDKILSRTAYLDIPVSLQGQTDASEYVLRGQQREHGICVKNGAEEVLVTARRAAAYASWTADKARKQLPSNTAVIELSAHHFTELRPDQRASGVSQLSSALIHQLLRFVSPQDPAATQANLARAIGAGRSVSDKMRVVRELLQGSIRTRNLKVIIVIGNMEGVIYDAVNDWVAMMAGLRGLNAGARPLRFLVTSAVARPPGQAIMPHWFDDGFPLSTIFYRMNKIEGGVK